MNERPKESPPLYLPLLWRAGILAIVVVQFVVGHGTVWTHLFDWDRSILYSYFTIPVLVTIALVVRHQFRALSLFLNTLEIVCVKYMITLAIVLFMLSTDTATRQPVAASK